jgi:hypothetical protein
VTVAEGATSATFSVRTQRPRSDATVTITATSGSSTKAASLTVRR